MRRSRYPRNRDPVFSKKFTLLLIFLAIAAAGFAIYIVFFSYPRVADINQPSDLYETNNYYENEYYPSSEPYYLDETYTPTEVYDPVGAYSPSATHTPSETYTPSGTHTPSETYPPSETYRPTETGFVLLTTVDNYLLPWYLKLVNRYNYLQNDFEPNLAYVGWGHYFDARAYTALLDMLASARNYGLSPIVASAFRSVTRQTELFNNQVQRHINNGYDWDDAFEMARRVVAYPGTSEHNLGLAVDIVALSYQNLTANQAYTPEGMWLAQNSYRYGFVLRYPYDKQDITNIIFEPWHFRYVGIEAATEMFYRDLVLEEFVSEILTR